jgi:hypothetical protein
MKKASTGLQQKKSKTHAATEPGLNDEFFKFSHAQKKPKKIQKNLNSHEPVLQSGTKCGE